MMQSIDPMQRVQLAERSLRGFLMGLLGLIPLLGLPLATLGLWIGLKTLKDGREAWNPGRSYSIAAVVLGSLSLILQFLFFILPVVL